MKPFRYLVPASLLLAALTPLSSRGATNTWNNASADFLWNVTSADWSSPTIWADGNDAIFGAIGAGTVTLGAPVMPNSITFNASGYTLNGAGNPLTLGAADAAITANADVTIAASLNGTNGVRFQGASVVTLLGDTNTADGNHFTGGAYVRGGTLILGAQGAVPSGSGYAVDSIEALDSGATVRLESTFDGTQWSGAPQGQIAYATGGKLHMTGGTFDLYNDPKSQNVPMPDGNGLIINTGPDVQAGLNLVVDGQDHEFSGSINDGNNGALIGDNSGQGPGYQIGIVTLGSAINGGGGTWTLSGHNTYSGSTRIDNNATLKLAGAGTLGNPTPNGLTGPLRIYNGALDLNGTSQTIALMTHGSTSGKIYNSAVGTLSTLTFGYGNEPVATRSATMQYMDNLGDGGILALTKIGTNCNQDFNGVNTYSGDTTVKEGSVSFASAAAVSPNTDIHLFKNGGALALNYSGSAPVHALYIDGIPQPLGVYGASTAPITGTGSLQVTGAPNIWNNASADFLWNGASANWTAPTKWVDGDDAFFGAAGIGAVTLSAPVTAHNLTFNAAGYTLAGAGNALTLSGNVPIIKASGNVKIQASIDGTNGLTIEAATNLWLMDDGVAGSAYTGGTYVKSGALILRNMQANANGSAYAVDSIEAIDAGASVQLGNINDGLDQSTSDSKVANGQISFAGSVAPVHHLNLTGGTFDTNGDDNNTQVPQPSGWGIITDTSPYARGICKFVAQNGATTTFSGQITDGGITIARANNGPGYQMNVDSQGNTGPAGTLILSGSNSFTGFIRIGNGGTIRLSGAGTLGYPSPINCPSRQVIQNNGAFDFNGTSQKTGYFYTGNSGSAILTNTAVGTLSVLTVGYNCTNLTTYTNSGFSKGIQTDIQDDPATSGLMGLTKEGVCIQPIGLSGGSTAFPNNNYHGDTTVNNGVLLVWSAGAISPNSAYRLSTQQGKLDLEYSGTALVKQLYINGVQMPNGVYGAAQTTAITGPGTLTVMGATSLGYSQSGNTITLSWANSASASFKLQAQTNAPNAGISANWFDYPGGASSPVMVQVDHLKGSVFFRLKSQ